MIQIKSAGMPLRRRLAADRNPSGLGGDLRLDQLAPDQPLEILVIDLVALCLGEIERIENPDRLADVARALLGIERTIGCEHEVIERIECHAADRRGMRPEYRGIGIEVVLEIIARPFLEALAQRYVVFIRRARAELVPS